ncbi:MAG: sialate O-acetylesterase [Lachnospiraceae bacterium]|nr:sialate O-acetylesterase [Lachnospiraceae bacterium]
MNMDFGKGLYGALIHEGISDWQILQQEKGYGTARIQGSYRVPPLPGGRRIIACRPVIRIVGEEDNGEVCPWKEAELVYDTGEEGGKWEAELKIPAGGLYRIESGLECREDGKPDRKAIYRGDSRFHVGAGNVFVIAGQSNASGLAHDPAYDPPDLRVHVFRNRNRWELAAHPLNDATEAYDNGSNEIGRCGSSPFLQFARRFAGKTGLPVGLIPTAMSGQSITRWDDRADGGLLRNMFRRIAASGAAPRALLWYQGCTDAVDGQGGKYSERFEHIVGTIRRKLGYEIPFFTFQLNRILSGDGGENWGIIREAQRAAALRIPKVYILPTLDCALGDIIHNSAPANLVLGERLARQCLWRLEGGKFYEAPDILSAELIISDRCIELKFGNVAGRLVAPSGNAQACGFYAEDDLGELELSGLEGQGEGKNIRMETARPAQGKVFLSFLHEANPKGEPLRDDGSFLIPLSFYRFPVHERTAQGEL